MLVIGKKDIYNNKNTEKERKQIGEWQENERETHSNKKMQIKPSLKNEKKKLRKIPVKRKK